VTKQSGQQQAGVIEWYACRSREEAFRIGAEIAREVTASNPPPVTLKFEKVYHPCVLLTKKRYVGYMYETPSQVVCTCQCLPSIMQSLHLSPQDYRRVAMM